MRNIETEVSQASERALQKDEESYMVCLIQFFIRQYYDHLCNVTDDQESTNQKQKIHLGTSYVFEETIGIEDSKHNCTSSGGPIIHLEQLCIGQNHFVFQFY